MMNKPENMDARLRALLENETPRLSDQAAERLEEAMSADARPTSRLRGISLAAAALLVFAFFLGRQIWSPAESEWALLTDDDFAALLADWKDEGMDLSEIVPTSDSIDWTNLESMDTETIVEGLKSFDPQAPNGG